MEFATTERIVFHSFLVIQIPFMARNLGHLEAVSVLNKLSAVNQIRTISESDWWEVAVEGLSHSIMASGTRTVHLSRNSLQGLTTTTELDGSISRNETEATKESRAFVCSGEACCRQKRDDRSECLSVKFQVYSNFVPVRIRVLSTSSHGGFNECL